MMVLNGLGVGCSSEKTEEPSALSIVDASRMEADIQGFPEYEHANNIMASDHPFTSRAQAVTIADQLSLALEGKKPPQTLLGAELVGDLRRRAYRTFHQPADAREAILQYDMVTRGQDAQRGCISRLASLALRGEIEDNLDSIYLSIYEETKKQLPVPCEGLARRALEDLRAYRPDASRLAEIDRRFHQAQVDGGAGKEAVVKPGPETRAGPSKIESIEVFSSRDAARVVIQLTAPALYEVVSLGAEGAQGPRVYVDLQKTKRGQAPRERRAEGLVTAVRLGTHQDKTRVVLDLSQQAFKRVFYMPEPFRIVLDISTTAPISERAKGETGPRQVRRVVLDPGHGGSDPGAIGPGGLKEKDVTLDIAHRVAPILSREMGIVTMLTRDDDRYVALEERAARANAFHADLFVSIHCNAAEDPSHRGVQTFVLAGAKDEASRRLAARENAASMAAGQQMGAVLDELHLESVSHQSWQFATLLQRATLSSLSESYGAVPDGGVRSAAFFVLVGAQMPAALFEVSFVSNPQEETRLATVDYRQKLADGVVNAIRAYRDGR
jgi:N-acetylmuramoyl-L-alanine amidase